MVNNNAGSRINKLKTVIKLMDDREKERENKIFDQLIIIEEARS